MNTISFSENLMKRFGLHAKGTEVYHFSLQAHNDLLRTYESKLRQFGIPTEELGFKPLESTVGGQTLGHGPAGLVSAPS